MGCCRRSAIEICLVIPIPSFAAALSGVSRGTCVQCRRVRFSVWTVASGARTGRRRRSSYPLLHAALFFSATALHGTVSQDYQRSTAHTVVRSGQALSASPPTRARRCSSAPHGASVVVLGS